MVVLSSFSGFGEWEFGTFSNFWTTNLRRNIYFGPSSRMVTRKWIRSRKFGGQSICYSSLDQVLWLVPWIFLVFVKGDKHLLEEIL